MMIRAFDFGAIAAAGALSLIALSGGCTQNSDSDGPSVAAGEASSADMGDQGAVAAPNPAMQPDVAPVTAPDTGKAGNSGREEVLAAPSKSAKVFAGRLTRAIAVTSMATQGRISVKDGCLVATINGSDAVLVMPPQAKLLGPTDAPTAVQLGTRRLTLGGDVILPGGGADLGPGDLVQAIPANCPTNMFVLGG